MTDALAAIAHHLRCPNCGGALATVGRSLRCPAGHGFDIARQGHVLLLPPRGKVASGDSADMLAARAAFQAAGHYAPMAEEVAAAAAGEGPVVDLGAGTGYYLAAAIGDRYGVALDVSRAALRRAARAHERIAAVGCDVWQQLPLQDGAAGVVLDVFAPRNGAEIARVLAPGGVLVVVTPAPDHLHELAKPLGLVGVDPAKQARLHAGLGPSLEAESGEPLAFEMTLGHGDVANLLAMGPTARHVEPGEAAARVAALPDPVRVTASVIVETFRRR